MRMKHSKMVLGFAVVALFLGLSSCKSESLAASRNVSADMTWKPSWGQVQGFVRLDSNSGSNTGDGTSAVPTNGTAPLQAEWAKGVLNDTVSTYLYSIAVDGQGNIYAVGNVLGIQTSQLGDGINVSGAGPKGNALIAKYDSSGQALWAQSTGTETAGESNFSSIAVDESGNAYVVGTIRGTVTFSDTVKVEGKYEGTNLVLVKYNSLGYAQWARTLARSDGLSAFNSVAVDKEGNVIAAGYAWKSFGAEEGSVALSPRGPKYYAIPEKSGGGALLAKFDSSGNALWAVQVGGMRGSGFYSVALGDTGGIYAAGYIAGNGTYDFGNGVLLAVSGSQPSNRTFVALVKYSASGKAQWAHSLERAGADNCDFRSIRLDHDGNVYASGEMFGPEPFQFGNAVTVQGPSKRRNLLVMKYDTSGKPQWGRSLVGGRGDFEFHATAIDDRLIYLSGSFEIKTGKETYDFGGNVMTKVENHIGRMEFLIAYDHSGVPRWVVMPPSKGQGDLRIRSICLPDNGSMVVGGTIYSEGALDLLRPA